MLSVTKTKSIQNPSKRLVDLMRNIEKQKEESQKEIRAKMDSFFPKNR